MRARVLITLVVALLTHGFSPIHAQVNPSGSGKLAFTASGTNEFAFDTGVLKGKLRADGKSRGLSSVWFTSPRG